MTSAHRSPPPPQPAPGAPPSLRTSAGAGLASPAQATGAADATRGAGAAGATGVEAKVGALAWPGHHSPAVGFEAPFEMLAACHERVRRSLALLDRLVQHLQTAMATHLALTGAQHSSQHSNPVDQPKVGGPSGDLGLQADAQACSAAADVARYFSLAAPQHHLDEERHLLPGLLASGDAQAVAAAHTVLADHAAFAALWAELGPRLQALARGAALSPDDLAQLSRLAQAFISRHASHLALEDGLVFPWARARSSAAAQQAMGQEMAARRQAAAG